MSESSYSGPRRGKPFNIQKERGLMPVCGMHAVDAVFRCRPGIVERLFFDETTGKRLGELCRYMASERKLYRQVPKAELARIGGTSSHGGVVAMTRRDPLEALTPSVGAYWAEEGFPILLLDGVSNAHNFGELARTALFFGIQKIGIADTRRQARLSPAALRSARGGLDMADLRLVDNMPSLIKALRKHYMVIGSSPAGLPLPDILALCPEEDVGKPVAIVVGNEEDGLSNGVADVCSALVSIEGSGAIDCLDIAAETALLMQKYVAEGL